MQLKNLVNAAWAHNSEACRKCVEISLSDGEEKPVDMYTARNNTNKNQNNILKNCPKNEDLD